MNTTTNRIVAIEHRVGDVVFVRLGVDANELQNIDTTGLESCIHNIHTRTHTHAPTHMHTHTLTHARTQYSV